VIPSGTTSRSVRKAAVFVEAPRVLPETSKSFTPLTASQAIFLPRILGTIIGSCV
jgi:hypothetical protein